MSDNAELIATARQRLSDIDTPTLQEMWTTEGRTEWAEAALRLELLERGISADGLDFIAQRRAHIAANAPPSARKTIWHYGVVGRCATLAGISFWILLVKAVNGPGILSATGAVAIMGLYVYVLSRRTKEHQQHSLSASAQFAMTWQLGEAWLLLLGSVIVSAIILAG